MSRKSAPDLYNSSPGVWVCCRSGAVWAHVRLHHILNHEGLLQYGAIEHLTLYCQLCFESTGMGLCPDEPCIYQLDLRTVAVLKTVRLAVCQAIGSSHCIKASMTMHRYIRYGITVMTMVSCKILSRMMQVYNPYICAFLAFSFMHRMAGCCTG